MVNLIRAALSTMSSSSTRSQTSAGGGIE